MDSRMISCSVSGVAKRVGALFVLLVVIQTMVHGQSKDTLDITSLSFEDLMNVKIVSASKKSENLFDAPLSASVISSEEIERSGATTIQEALRLVPGLIVRQLTNGNYDVHIRGLDNAPPNALRLNSTNTTALVMIDNRPVYNYLQGGIIWESLTIDLHDIDRIEVVRGPSSTLYGPNAVSGVINVITKKTNKKGVNTNANVQAGTLNTLLANGSVGYQFGHGLNFILSGNYQTRGRDVLYQDLLKQKWYTNIDSLTTSDASREYPHPDRSLIKQGLNTFIRYQAKDKIELNIAAGLQKSEAQTCTFDSFTSNINTFTSKSGYVDLQAVISGFTAQASYNTGNQQTILGFKTSFDYYTTDLSLEYAVKIKGLSIKPGFAYRSAIYDDTKRGDISKREGTLNARRHMENYGATLRGEYTVGKERIRITGGARAEQFTYPGNWFISYQGATSIKISEKNLVRVVISRAYRSPFIYDTYQDLQLSIPLGTDPQTYIASNMLGNKNLNLLSSTMFEIGYRTKVSSNFIFDFEIYSTKTKNFTALIVNTPVTPTPENFPFVATFDSQALNTPLQVQQTGASLSATVQLNNFQLKPFITVQKSTLHNYSTFSNTSDVSPDPTNNFDPETNNIYSGMGTKMDHKFTPKVFGGVYANYKFEKFNINLNAYYFSRHTFYHSYNLYFNDGRGVGLVREKAVINTKISYYPIKSLSLFVNIKNILNDQSREYYLSDLTPVMIFGGLSAKM